MCTAHMYFIRILDYGYSCSSSFARTEDTSALKQAFQTQAMKITRKREMQKLNSLEYGTQ